MQYIIHIQIVGGTQTGEALKIANEQVLQIKNGMRPKNDGIPKIVMTITDGQSNDALSTKQNANKIKRREFNMISVGVANSNPQELFELATTSNDQYFVKDFGKIKNIISDITRKTCQQPATVEEETELEQEVEKDNYKYFKYNLNPIQNGTLRNINSSSFMANFTIKLSIINGSSDLYYSFENSLPKADDDYISTNQSETLEDVNFFGGDSVAYKNNRYKRQLGSKAYPYKSNQDKFYQIYNPNNNNVLYLSVKGLEDVNKFKVLVYNRTVEAINKPVEEIIKPVSNNTCVSAYDTGKNMIGQCANIDECTGAAIIGNCTNLICCVPDTGKQPIIQQTPLTEGIFFKIVSNTTRNRVIYKYVVESLTLANIRTNYEIAAYLSQIIGETKDFIYIESTIIDRDEDPNLGNSNKSDGTNYRGRGGILVRGKKNYNLANLKQGIPFI